MSEEGTTKYSWMLRMMSNFNTFFSAIKNYLALFMIFTMIGISIGMYIAKQIYDWRMDEITFVKGFTYGGKIYDMKERLILVPQTDVNNNSLIEKKK